MHIGMQSYAAAAHLATRVYNEQQVCCIFRFSCNRDFPIQSVMFDVRRTDRQIGFPTKAPQELPLPELCSKPPVPPCLRTVGQGKHRECRSLLFPKTHSVDYWITLGKHTLSLERNAVEATSFPEGVMWKSTYGLTP